jgi:hypothetical protein
MTKIELTWLKDNAKVIESFSVNGVNYAVDWDSDHYGDIQITESDVEKLKALKLEQFVTTNEEDKEDDDELRYFFDLGGMVQNEEGDWLSEEDIGEMFGLDLHPDFNGGYGNG